MVCSSTSVCVCFSVFWFWGSLGPKLALYRSASIVPISPFTFTWRQHLTQVPRLALNSLCSSGRSWTLGHPVSPSLVPGITDQQVQFGVFISSSIFQVPQGPHLGGCPSLGLFFSQGSVYWCVYPSQSMSVIVLHAPCIWVGLSLSAFVFSALRTAPSIEGGLQ